MSKAKTNALDALRALIAERQQYEQWISALEAKREGTPEHVFERVQKDYGSRLDRVVGEIKGHAEELQLSISTLSSRLVEVAREEDTRREGLQEAELRAAVGEYEPAQWDQIRSEAEEALSKIAADRQSLDSQLGELRSIQKLSEMGPGASVTEPTAAAMPEIIRPPVAPAEPAVESGEAPQLRRVMWPCRRLQLLASRNLRGLPRRSAGKWRTSRGHCGRAAIVPEPADSGAAAFAESDCDAAIAGEIAARAGCSGCIGCGPGCVEAALDEDLHRAELRLCALVQKLRSPMPQRLSSVRSAEQRTIRRNGIASDAEVSSRRCKTKRAPRGARLISYSSSSYFAAAFAMRLL